MAPSTQQLLKDALQLPDQQRAELVVELLDSLPSVEPGQERSDAQWLAEIERRARAAQAGATRDTIPSIVIPPACAYGR